MAYTTTAQVQSAAGGEDRLLQICADANGDLDTTRLAHAQLHADMLIDGHSRMRFAELLDDADAVVDTAVALAAAETVHQLKCQIGQNTANDDALAEARLALYEKIAAGTFRPAEPLPTKSSAVKSERIANARDVSADKLKGFW